MRPEILNPLFTEAEALKGVGPQLAKALKRIGLTRVVDLLYHLPTGAIERVRATAASSALLGRTIILDLTPFDTRQSRSGRGPFRVLASDSDGNTISLIYFNNPGWAKKSLPMGERKIVSGKLEAYGDEWQIIHPEVVAAGRDADLPLREPVYGLTEGRQQSPDGRARLGRAGAGTGTARMDRAGTGRSRRLAAMALGARRSASRTWRCGRSPAPRL